MRAISLHQPWATAMALGFKTFETRDWRPQVDAPFDMAIHAAKVWRPEQVRFYSNMRTVHPDLPAEMPLGKIVAVVSVRAFHRTEEAAPGLGRVELLWGNYDPLRWAWETSNLRVLREPLAWRGQQGFFAVPDSVLRGALT